MERMFEMDIDDIPRYSVLHNERLLSFAVVHTPVQKWEQRLKSAAYYFEVLSSNTVLICNIRLDDLVGLLREIGYPDFAYCYKEDNKFFVQHWKWGKQLLCYGTIRGGYVATDHSVKFTEYPWDWEDDLFYYAFMNAFSTDTILKRFHSILHKMQAWQDEKGYSDEKVQQLLKKSMDGCITVKSRYYARKTLYYKKN